MWCETPKSPPGDYNRIVKNSNANDAANVRVKHLNPRQGITTRSGRAQRPADVLPCETPKSPPGDYNAASSKTPISSPVISGVKHLNPRQGITTSQRGRRRSSHRCRYACETPKSPPGDYNLDKPHRLERLLERVKHLNPRQGITTQTPRLALGRSPTDRCETPKSPPGDYNPNRVPHR